jgi:2-oxoglutarate ferredoxin oxidoreductase subunit alpha
VAPGTYRNTSGNTATARGIAAAATVSGVEHELGSYPITPASDVLHELSRLKHFGISTVQAEDEIAAVCIAIGASYTGKVGVTSTSGPGLALKTEAIGLAVAVELPLVVINVQRAGPSTGMPTKTEQADLLQAMYGRNGEAPLCVLAACTPSDCFNQAFEAVRIATKYMTPVILLTDGYLANGAEPWRIPALSDLPKIEVKYRENPEGFHPFIRDPETLARAWAKPGTPGLQHRIGGLEKNFDSGHISYDPDNHQKMSETRQQKIDNIALDVPQQEIEVGDKTGKLLVLGWGSTHGAIREAVTRCRARGLSVSHAHVRNLNPFPRNLGELLNGFERVLVPELNMGQLVKLIRARYLIAADSYAKIEGLPFKIEELETRIRKMLES